ncbi:hypothetical protein VAS14_07389 [Photobacterium angustum S14]|uniref:Uncharacterized protein n=1 Tax=Photobacterium angustum (strain S14 / CCUG 15956) TaxID=314292 RepID=Q1ZMR1_PHOAS|nr:hypothetical protein VAS14_07389 [Photobacterium angustum S14]
MGWGKKREEINTKNDIKTIKKRRPKSTLHLFYFNRKD